MKAPVTIPASSGAAAQTSPCAVSQFSKVPVAIHASPIGNRRNSRLTTCATEEQRIWATRPPVVPYTYLLRSLSSAAAVVPEDAFFAVGDDLAVRLAGRKLLIGELLLRTAAFVDLRHFNPGKSFRVDSAQIVALHKVMGEAI